ncbi:hypothetical protein [Paenarthrobacter nitroguajacolicus]|uniref:hypothetical protein n=1 Tax=Paenarthrobacter nitroguajacolicus TaxID=211146 RepID=UPI0015BC1CF2|nr:hypothetical protein [Paenarthrobacter nitroguajacolicus]
MTSATTNTSRPSLPDGPVAAAKLMVAYHRTNGTLPTVASAPDSEEAELYRSLKRLRLVHRQGKLEPAASKVLDKRIPVVGRPQLQQRTPVAAAPRRAHLLDEEAQTPTALRRRRR